MNFVFFADGCNIVCGNGAECFNVPGSSATCRCLKAGYVYENGKCVKPTGKIVKVSGLKLKQAYVKEYSDPYTEPFRMKAVEIENVLCVVVCTKIFGCMGIRVLRMTEGSIVVDYGVIMNNTVTNITNKHILDVSKQSLKDTKMVLLGADQTSTLAAQGNCQILFFWYLGKSKRCIYNASTPFP